MKSFGGNFFLFHRSKKVTGRNFFSFHQLSFALPLLFLAMQAWAVDPWSSPPFTADAATLRQASATVKRGEHNEVTVLLYDLAFTYDAVGMLVEDRHLIYRIENEKGVEGWAQVSGRWEPWRQSKPVIKARVISVDGTEHALDLKTLNDFPIHDNEPDVYSDDRKYGGPLPAIAPGAIVEEEVTIRDTAPLFAAGTAERWGLGWSVPVNRTRVAIRHPESLPLRYEIHNLPNASVNKATDNGVETLLLEQGELPAYNQRFDHLPPDVALRPEIEFSSGSTWKNVAREYARMSEDKLRVADVQAVLSKIKAHEGSRDDRIRRIVAALHKDVRYTGIEFGESKLVPQFPAETLTRRYGDCKDKAALLVTMLRAADIPAFLALLSSGPGRDINTNMPGMGMFDHAIVFVPGSATDPEIWIDATARYTQVGTLPWMDYGRWALVVNQNTDELKRIPELTAAQNVHTEMREFTLAEHGHAMIVETDNEVGPGEADYRDYYNGDSKELHQSAETYVKNMYLADSLTSLDHGDLADLEKPATVKFVSKGARGTTDFTSATAAIRVEGLFDSLPKYFRAKEDKKEDEDSSKDDTPRTADWSITPFVTEWQYKVVAPIGFKLRALPTDKDQKVDVVRFTQKYSSNETGTVVEAVLRVESTATRLTTRQAEQLRDAVVKARNSDPILLNFDNIGHALIAAGKFREGLSAYQQMVAQHPKEALHKVQLAQALLTAGLGEEARNAARQATLLEPGSALAQATLAMTLKYDLVGRLLKKGMDYGGAVDAYKQSVALDPKDKDNRANLAILLEYDSDGERYSEKASLKDAVVQFRELRKQDEEYGRTYDENVLFDLWYSGDYQGVLDYAAAVQSTKDSSRGLTLAAIAVLHGSDTALKKAVEIASNDDARARMLATAGAVLIRSRKYKEAAALITAEAHGQSEEGQILHTAGIIGKTRPYDEMKLDPAEPRSVVLELFGKMLSGRLTYAQARKLTFVDPNENEAENEKEFHKTMATMKSTLGAMGVPLLTVADMAVSNMRCTLDGDDNVGYKVIVESPGAAAQTIYVLKEEGIYKVGAFNYSDSGVESLAPLALNALEKNNLPAARKWLDRARESIKVNSGEDALSGQPFPFFWTKGQEADAETIRTAALVLLASKSLKGPYYAALDHARSKAKTDIDRGRLTMVLAYARSAQEQWNELLPLAEDLVKSFPSSLRAFELVTTAYVGLSRFDEWEKLVKSRIQAYPDELAYVRSSARLALYRSQFAKAREITKTIIDKGQGSDFDLNLFAWYALYVPGPVTQDSLDSAERASELTKNANFAIMHTLACLDARSGKTSQARDLLLKAMEIQHMDEPDSSIWLAFGMIAEQYGVQEAAQKMYARVEKQKIESPGSNYALAQQRLAAIRSLPGGPAKSAGQ